MEVKTNEYLKIRGFIIGNLLVPLIEKITLPKAFGKGGEKA